MVKARIDTDLCKRDHRCLPEMHCPSAAISKNPDFEGLRMLIDEEKCIGCGKCVKVCKNNAITMERYEKTVSQ